MWLINLNCLFIDVCSIRVLEKNLQKGWVSVYTSMIGAHQVQNSNFTNKFYKIIYSQLNDLLARCLDLL